MLDASVKLIRQGGMVGLCGDRGTGKTQLGVECIRLFCAEGGNAIYLRMQEVFDLARDAYNKKISEKQAIRRLISAKLLVLDECQERGATEFEHRILSLIIDSRYGAKRPTVFIANLKPADLESQLGSSIASRLDEMGAIFWCGWKSFRKANQQWQQTGP